MSKSLGALKSHYQSGNMTTADCWLVVRKDGVRFGFNEHPESLTIDGDLYEGNVGFDRTAAEAALGLSADNQTLVGTIDSSRITNEDIQGGKFQGASVHYFTVNYNDPNGAKDKHSFGFLGEITLKGKVWEAEFTSLATLLERELGELRTPYCRVKLGSSRCGVALNPDVWTSVVTVAAGDFVSNPTPDGLRHKAITGGVTSTVVPAFASIVGSSVVENGIEWQAAEGLFSTFTVTSVIAGEERRTFLASVLGGTASNWYQFGEVAFTSGTNSGLTMDVKANTSAGQVEVLFEYPFSIAIGDTGTLSAGCNHLLKAAGDVAGAPYTGHCRTKFENAPNFQGDPETPGIDIILAGDSE